MRIKNLDKIKSMVKAKLPEYLKEVGCTIESTKVSCPNIEVHDHADKGKLSAAFLPNSNNQAIYCFVEERAFDIFDVYALKNNLSLNGVGFYKVVKALGEKYGIPIEEEYEYSMKEKELNRKRNFIQTLHKLSMGDIKRGLKYYKKRGLSKEKIKYFQVGWLEPRDIPKALDDECKTLFEYQLSKVFIKGGLVMPIFNQEHQYNGLVIRMFETKRNDEYLKVCIEGGNLFNVQNVRGKEELTIVEGSFDAMALYPLSNVVGCLTNVVNDANLETISEMKISKINLALDPDNLYRGKARDGILRSIIRMKNLEAQINIIKFPETDSEIKPDPDEYMKTHSLEDFKALPKIPALVYLLKNHQQGLVNAKTIYEFIAGCPDMIRKEKYITIAHKFLKVGKRELTKEIDNMSQDQHSFNMIQYVQEKESYDNLLEDFTEQAWNKNYNGIPTGYPLFDKWVGGLEDTLYVMIGFPERGKSAFLLNFVFQLAHFKNAFVAFYSLDDGAKRSILPRLMSIASGLTSKNIKQPTSDIKEAWFTGLDRLKSLKENMVIKDGSEVKTIKDLDNFVKIHSTMAEEMGKKFILVIDNVHDITANAKLESVQNSQQVAAYLKRLPQVLNCPILVTAEVPKSASGKPEGKDIKDSIDLWYAARFVAGIHSNFHDAKKKTDTNLAWVDDEGKSQPIMELFITKNQTGDTYHGSLYYKFSLTNNRLVEASEKETQLLKDGQFLTFLE